MCTVGVLYAICVFSVLRLRTHESQTRHHGMASWYGFMAWLHTLSLHTLSALRTCTL